MVLHLSPNIHPIFIKMKYTLVQNFKTSLFMTLLAFSGGNLFAAEPAAEFLSASEGVQVHRSDEYLYGQEPSLKMEFPERTGDVRFKTLKQDWSTYKELVFTVYNPWNDRKFRILTLEDAKGKPIRLPQKVSVPGGQLDVPRESRVTFRLDLQDPELTEVIDLKNITGIRIIRGTEETTFFLDGFTLRTAEEVENEARKELAEKIQAIETRLTQNPVPNAYQKRVHILLGQLETAKEKSPEAGFTRTLLDRAGALATVLERAKEGETRAVETVFVSSMKKIFREDSLRPEEKHFIEAAGNERVSFQAVVVPFRSLEQVKVEALPLILRGQESVTIDAKEVRVNTVGYVDVPSAVYYETSRIGWWPDPLLKSAPVDVDARVQPFWITVHVPAGQPAGLYDGKLRVTAEDGIETTFEYQLQVWGFSLPVRGQLRTLMSFTYKPEEEAIRRAIYTTLLEHRISPVNIYANASKPTTYQPEWTDLEFCLERGLNTLVLWHPSNKEAEFHNDYDDAYINRMLNYIGTHEKQLKSLGAWDMAMVLGFDEITHKGREYEERSTIGAQKIYDALQERFPGLVLANIGGPPLAKIKGEHNLWIPLPGRILQDYWSEEVEKMRKGDYFFYWVYEDPTFMLDLPGISPRWLSWIAFKYGAQGIGYYSTIRPWMTPENAPEGVDWSHEEFPIESERKKGRHGDGILVYPARDGTILTSIRLANTRDGIQDFEYLAMLRDLLADKPDDEANRLLEPPDSFLTYSHYSKDPDVLLQYRRDVAHAIERLKQEKPE